MFATMSSEQIRNGRADGLGTFTGLAIRYEGQWQNGYRHGVGFMIYERREVGRCRLPVLTWLTGTARGCGYRCTLESGSKASGMATGSRSPRRAR